MSGLGRWESGEVVDEDTVVVREELAAENSHVVTSYSLIKGGHKKSANIIETIVYITCKSRKWNN
jgi:hypothetical protein